MDVVTTHVNGIPWFIASKPWCWHRCVPWTVQVWRKWSNARIEHCRCGAERAFRGDGSAQYAWVKRNSRRKPKVFTPTIPAPFRLVRKIGGNW